MYFFTSDLHIGDNSTIKREFRPFNNDFEFQFFIKNDINNNCNANDYLIIVGDLINYNQNYKKTKQEVIDLYNNFIKNLKCKVILIIGNNEDRIIKELFNNNLDYYKNTLLRLGYSCIANEFYVEFGNYHFYINHYPIYYKKPYVNLFGHTHRATGLWKPYGLNVGTDINHFRVYSENDILEILKQKELYWDNDPDTLCL